MTQFQRDLSTAKINGWWFKSTEGEWFSPYEMVALMRTPGYKYFPENWTLQDPQILRAVLLENYSEALKQNYAAYHEAVREGATEYLIERYDDTMLAVCEALEAYLNFKSRLKSIL